MDAELLESVAPVSPARALVLLLYAVKAPPLLFDLARNLYALHGYEVAARFVIRHGMRPCQ
jgi:hypothetical protein